MALFVSACNVPTTTHTVRGLLVDVEGVSLQRMDGFTLRTEDGRELRFQVASDFNAGVSHPMTPGHMRQHMALAEPITVTYRDEGGNLIALSATD